MNNKCFILYDSLVSFIVLSSFILFFIFIVNINQQNMHYSNIKMEALHSFRNSIYNYYNNGKFLKVENNDYYSTKKKDNYCIHYKKQGGYEKICIKQ